MQTVNKCTVPFSVDGGIACYVMLCSIRATPKNVLSSAFFFGRALSGFQVRFFSFFHFRKLFRKAFELSWNYGKSFRISDCQRLLTFIERRSEMERVIRTYHKLSKLWPWNKLKLNFHVFVYFVRIFLTKVFQMLRTFFMSMKTSYIFFCALLRIRTVWMIQ